MKAPEKAISISVTKQHLIKRVWRRTLFVDTLFGLSDGFFKFLIETINFQSAQTIKMKYSSLAYHNLVFD